MAASEGRQRLDRTLASPVLAHKESVNLIVKRHLVKSSLANAGNGNLEVLWVTDIHNTDIVTFGSVPLLTESGAITSCDGKLGVNELDLGGKYFDEVAQYWSSKIWIFLETLRSASDESIAKLSAYERESGSSREWKLKDQNERHRVMYREGPVGTPFHTLCLDGVMDGQMPNALCVGWEVPNYKDWFPQFTVPAFKITEAKWLRKVRVGESLSLVRLKVPWPVSPREIIMSAFEFEYLEEDVIIVLLESAPEPDEINEKLHGFSADDVPPLSQNVRMHICGGFVMQKMNADQFFFRTIADLDMKLDFVPPWIINFVARQVAGQGLKVYQKVISAVGHGTGSGKAFQSVLKTEPLYERVRVGLDAKAATDGEPFISLPVERLPAFKDSVKAKTLQGSIKRIGSSESYRVVPFPVRAEEELTVENEINTKAEITHSLEQLDLQVSSNSQPPIPAFEDVKSEIVAEPVKSSEHASPKGESIIVEGEEAREYEDPEVEWALSILDKMIAYSRTCAVGKRANAPPNNSDANISPGLPLRDVSKPRVEINSSATIPVGVTKAHVTIDRRKPPLNPVKDQNSKKTQVLKSPLSALMKTPQRLVKQSPSMLLSSEEIEMSGRSSFLSASEIEAVSGMDDTDTETGASSRMSCPLTTQESEVQSRRRRNRWRWGACFSPRLTSKTDHHRKKSSMGDSGRRSEGHWRSTVGDSGRSLNQRGYVTDGDERYLNQSTDYPPDSDERFVTLGELLMDDEH